ncbi:MAG: hypothetical protein RLZZ399_2390 [Verrucomicrobiota bacterium]|jgi:hypothetical protein
MTTDWLTHPFALGLYTGLLPALFLRFQLFLSRRDMVRSEKQQFAQLKTLTDAFQKLQTEVTATGADNENLRVKIQSLLQSPEKQKSRQLEVLLRAEQRLTVTAPGFAPAWQTAKNEALAQLEEEERGKNAPKQMFSQLVSSGSSLLSRLRSNSSETAHPGSDSPSQ